MKRISVLLTISALLFSLSAHAKPIKVSLYLQNIKAIKLNEQSKDEIYFSIAEFSSDKNNRIYTMPGFATQKHRYLSGIYPTGTSGQFVLHWSSNYLRKLQHEKLWSRNLEDKQTVEIFLTVVEHDAQPWDLDDVIGAIKIRINNQNGKIISKWRFLSDEKSILLTSSKDKSGRRMGYSFQGGNSKYEVNFHLMY